MVEKYSDLNVGYVYVLYNKAVPGYVKIGMTTRDVSERAKELSNTGVPGEWKAHFSIFVPDCSEVERQTHRDLDKVRYSKNREFFILPLEEAELMVKRRAQENISQYPGWPNPKSVQNNLDRVVLEKRRERAENRLRLANKKTLQEKERKEAETKELLERKDSIDSSTKDILASAPFGWGTIVFAGFWLIIAGESPIGLCSAIGTILIGMWFRKNEKSEANELRQEWDLPPV